MRSQQSAIECRSLTKQFGDRTVVDDLSFTVEHGSITGFAGANGAGKSTTMRMVLGLVTPTSGHATVAGVGYRQLLHPRRQVGAVLDGPGAHPAQTGRAHLATIAAAAELPAQRVHEVLEVVQLAEHAHHRVGGYSTGMRQRLAMAAALLGDPPILLLDEPTNGLDPAGMRWMRDLLRGLAEEGRAVLISSHVLTELAEVVDRAVILHRGRLVADATLTELLAGRERRVELRCARPDLAVDALRAAGAPTHRETDAVVVQGWSAQEVGDLVAAAGAGPVHGLSERASSLEDVYFDLAGGGAEPSDLDPGQVVGPGVARAEQEVVA